MREGGLGMKKAVKTVWECVRTVTGDNAYDRYLQHSRADLILGTRLSRGGVLRRVDGYEVERN